jgi:hypothetical protein
MLPTPSCCSTKPPVGAMRDLDRLAFAALRETARKTQQW